MSKILQSIQKLLQKHRILLWYDTEQAFLEEFRSLDKSDMEKLVVKGNEFEKKVTILHEQPDTKFLIYIPSGKPADKENRLLRLVPSWSKFGTKLKRLDWPNNGVSGKDEIQQVPSWDQDGTKLLQKKTVYLFRFSSLHSRLFHLMI